MKLRGRSAHHDSTLQERDSDRPLKQAEAADSDHPASHAAETLDYLGHYIRARLDLGKLALRNGLIKAAAGAVGLLVGVAIVATAAVLLTAGIAGGLGAMVGGRLWLGQLITGVLILGLVAAGGARAARSIRESSRKRRLREYARRKRRQRARFGRDAEQAARSV